MITRTRQELTFVNNAMKLQDNAEKIKERKDAYVLNTGKDQVDD